MIDYITFQRISKIAGYKEWIKVGTAFEEDVAIRRAIAFVNSGGVKKEDIRVIKTTLIEEDIDIWKDLK